jgi:glycosyltransferase 2 family protein
MTFEEASSLKSKILSIIKKLYNFLSEQLNNKSKRRIINSLILIISFVFVTYIVITNWTELSQQTFEIKYQFIILAIFLYPLGMFPTVAAWHTLLKSLDINVPFSKNLKIHTYTLLPRHIPGLIWYVSSRTVMYKDINISGKKILFATSLETILLILTGSIISIIWLPFNRKTDEHYIILVLSSFLALVTVILLKIFSHRINEMIISFQRRVGITDPRKIKRKEIIISFLWMFFAWIGGGIILFVLSYGFTPVKWYQLFSIIGMWGATGAISLSVGSLIQGMGLREISLTLLLSTIFPIINAVVIAISFRLVLTISEIIWLISYKWISKASS